MKVRWWAAVCATAVFAAFSCSTAHAKVGLAAQEQHEHHWDKDHPQFDDHERGVVRDWRARCHPVPADLLAGLPPPPPHYRYNVIGGHVVLVDGGWHVVDILSVEF
jgi:hypothetical protein